MYEIRFYKNNGDLSCVEKRETLEEVALVLIQFCNSNPTCKCVPTVHKDGKLM